MNERRDWAPVDWSPMKRLIYLRGNGATGGGGSPLTVTGATPLLMPGAVSKPLKKATFSIEAVQSGSGDPSPSNVRPITGWTGANVSVSGKNLLNPNDPDWGNYTIGPNGEYVTTTLNRVTSGYYRANAGDTFTVSGGKKGASGTKFGFTGVSFFDASKTFIGRTYYTDRDASYTVTAPAGTYYFRYSEQFTIYSEMSPSLFETTERQIEPGSTATPYTPYSGTSLSVEFPESVGTVYSGTIDPVTGQGVVDGIRFVFDGDTEKWATPQTSWYSNDVSNNRNSFGVYWYFMVKGFSSLPLPKTYASLDDSIGRRLSDKLKYQRYGIYGRDEDNIWDINSSPYFSLRLPKSALSDYSSASAMGQSVMEYFQQNPTEFYYEIATPIPFTIPPQSLTPPAGDAYIWADCGSSAECTYIGKA